MGPVWRNAELRFQSRRYHTNHSVSKVLIRGGSFKSLSSYNAYWGKLVSFSYYAYIYRKSRAGYRDNEHTDSEAENVAITYEPNNRFFHKTGMGPIKLSVQDSRGLE